MRDFCNYGRTLHISFNSPNLRDVPKNYRYVVLKKAKRKGRGRGKKTASASDQSGGPTSVISRHTCNRVNVIMPPATV